MLRFISFSIPALVERSVIICGHSMGGAIATKLVTLVSKEHDQADLYKKIKSLFVIDVVEGSALEALPLMEQIVKMRPQEFESLSDVVKYGFTNNLSKHIDSARVSMPE